jgi:hypothetical protein
MKLIVKELRHEHISYVITLTSTHESKDSLLNNQPDAQINQNLFSYKILHVSGILSAHHQEFSTVHSALVSFMQILMPVSKQNQEGTLLGNGHKKRHETLGVPNVQ